MKPFLLPRSLPRLLLSLFFFLNSLYQESYASDNDLPEEKPVEETSPPSAMLTSALPAEVLAHCLTYIDEPTRDKVVSMSCKFHQAVVQAREMLLDESLALNMRVSRERLPTRTDLYRYGCPDPIARNILRTFGAPTRKLKEPLGCLEDHYVNLWLCEATQRKSREDVFAPGSSNGGRGFYKCETKGASGKRVYKDGYFIKSSGVNAGHVFEMRDDDYIFEGSAYGLAEGYCVCGQIGVFTYAGEFKANKKHGKGVLVRHKLKDRFEGDFKDDQPNGEVVWTSQETGERYVGECRNAFRHGRGTVTRANGERLEATFSDGVLNGDGVLTFPNGDRYEGTFRHNVPHGGGILTRSDGTRLVVAYRDGTLVAMGTDIRLEPK